MNENPITITIENYKGKKLTFTASSEAAIHLWKTNSVSGKNKGKLIEAKIYFLDDGGIKEKEEEMN